MSDLEALFAMPRVDPHLLYTILEGRLLGLDGREIAGKYGMNKNTVSKYVAVLREFDAVDLAEFYLRRRRGAGADDGS